VHNDRYEVVLLAVVVVYSAIVTAQTSSTISGIVRDAAGAVIVNADVAVHWNIRVPDGPFLPPSKDVMLKADKDGRYSVAVVPGFYDVCVHAPAFTPRCTTLKAEQGHTAAYDPRMEASPVINFAD
jgi:carboxypeptidase family protein